MERSKSNVENQCLLLRYQKARHGSSEMEPREIGEASNLQCLMLILPIQSGEDNSNNKRY